MNIYITLDYEIYFGNPHGSVDKCIIQPTNELIMIAEKHNVRFSFFVDCGFIIKLKEYSNQYPELQKDYTAITNQIKALSASGHDIQLHIHPHWEDCYYNGERWIININRYKLTGFNETEIEDIFTRYKNVLRDLTGKSIFTYRAGGWCLQPFSKLKKAFIQNNITVDSSVFSNGYYTSEHYNYDFRNSPNKDSYRFDDNVVKENTNGIFTELPISSIHNSPLFFWKLFLLGRLNPSLYRPFGDGRAMPAPGYRKKLLTSFTTNPLSIDGYNAKLLYKGLRTLQKTNKQNMVVIGHPKALSPYSIIQLEKFISDTKEKHNFTTFSKEFL